MADFFALRTIVGNESVEGSMFSKWLAIDGRWVRVQAKLLPSEQRFELHLSEQSGELQKTAASRLAHLLDTRFEPSNLPADTAVVFHRLSNPTGIRIPRVDSVFEAGCRAILGQQVAVSAAIKRVNELFAGVAKSSLERPFISPDELLKTDLSFLRVPALRRQSLYDFADFCAQHNEQHLSAVIDQLLDIKGIGPWTLNYIKIRALGDNDLLLSGDLIIKRQLANLTIDTDRFAPYRSYLNFLLWQNAAISKSASNQLGATDKPDDEER